MLISCRKQTYIELELIIRNKHSCRRNPLTIEGVRRILLRRLVSVTEKGQP